MDTSRRWPLSKVQQVFWHLSRSAQGMPPRYNHLPAVVSLTGLLDAPALNVAWRRLIARHPALQTVFSDSGKVSQQLGTFAPFTLAVADLRDLPLDKQSLECERHMRETVAAPFDLTQAPAWRALLIRLSDTRHEMVVVAHHLICDAWSQGILLNELVELYRAERAGEPAHLPPLEATPFEFAEDERERLSDGSLESQIAYWIEQGQDAPVSLPIPTDRPASPSSAFPGRVERFAIPASLTAQVHAIAAAEGVSPFSVMLGAFFVWLRQLTASDDLWVAVPVANRGRRRWKPVVGCIAQQIHPRLDLSGAPTFRDVIARTHQAMRRGLRRSEVPRAIVEERINADRRRPSAVGMSGSTLLRATFAYQNALVTRAEAGGVTFDLDVRWDLLGVAREPMLWQFTDQGEHLDGVLEYRTDLFDRDTALGWIAGFLSTLDALCTGPSARIPSPSATQRPSSTVTQPEMVSRASSASPEPLAIVGIGCRFPGAAGPERLWELLERGGDAITEIPGDRWNVERFFSDDHARAGKTYAKHGGFIDHFDEFDAQFFGIAPREAARADPQQRLLLELAWEALEDAGFPAERVAGAPVGVFVAAASPDYLPMAVDREALRDIDAHCASGLSLSLISNRISYTFDLRGPSVTVDTACSGSLVAIHQACQAIWSGTCELAIAGGVQLNFMPGNFIMYSKATMLSPTGRCRSFDADADGFVRGEGGGLIALKPLGAAQRDGDRIYAVIRGAAITQDGRTPSLTMPSFSAQVAAIEAALRQADLPPRLVQYVEAHGPGTQVGDPIEAQALGAALAAKRDTALVLGSIKSNIGHLESAAGVAGLIKLALSLWHRTIPPNLHFRRPNPKIPLRELRLRVATALEPWPANHDGAPRIGAVNSFGFGGTNAHALLAEADAAPPVTSIPEVLNDPRPELLVLSARTEAALTIVARETQRYLETTSTSLADILHTAAVRRSRHPYRLALTGASRQELAALAGAFADGATQRGIVSGRTDGAWSRGPVFVFSGMGQQHLRMGRELFVTEPAFRGAVEACDLALRPHIDWSVRDFFAGAADHDVDRTAIAQVAIFSLQAGLAAVWRSWGVEPEAIVGHSVGEVAAAYVAGALTLDDAAVVIATRARLQAEAAGRGGMLAVGLSAADTCARFPFDTATVAIAAINSPRSVTLSGDVAELQRLSTALTAAGVFNRMLNVEVPYHSPAMEPLMPRLIEALAAIRPQPAHTRLVSTVTGQSIFGTEMTGAYWAENMRAPVRFEAAIRTLHADGSTGFIEIGAHPVLSAALRETLDGGGVAHASTRRDHSERATMLTTLGMLFVAGLPLDGARLYPAGRLARLPGHPWLRSKSWVESDAVRRYRLVADVNPLLGARLPLPLPTWRARIELDRLPFLRDHQIRGDIVFPMTAYFEMALAAARELFGERPTRISDMTLESALVIGEDDDPDVYTTVHADGASFSISSRHGDAFTRHFSGRIETATDHLPAMDVDAIRARCPEACDGADVYRRLAERGYGYGPTFQGIRRAWFGEHEALFEVEWPACLPQDQAFLAHPAIQDGYLNAAPLFAPPGLWIPSRVEEFRVLAPPPRHGWAYTRISAPTESSFTSEMTLLTLDGEVIATMRRLTFRRADGRRDGMTPAELAYQQTWEPQPLPGSPASQAGSRWLVLADRQGIAAAVAASVAALGGDVVLIHHSPDAIAQIRAAGDVTRVVHAWGLDPIEDADHLAETDYVDLIRVVQTLEQQAASPRLCLVTRAAWQIDNEPITSLPPIGWWGLGRTIASEYPAMRTRLMDIGARDGAEAGAIDALVTELASDDVEDEVALRQGVRWVPRLQQAVLTRPPGDRPYQLAIETPGSIDGLRFIAADVREPGPGEVVIAVEAAGVNFKDVVKTLGLIDRESLQRTSAGQALGGECAGRVIAVGDGVTGLAVGDAVVAMTSACFGPRAVAAARFVAPKPARLSFVEAATLPVAYLTAYFALHEIARARAGERVLVHAASGGVGQAALATARALGLTVLATAGNPEKRALLRDQGIACVMDSRSTAFADETLAATGGQGVHVVLNTLPAPTLPASLATLAPRGRLVDISNIYSGATVDLRAFQKGVSVTAFDLDQLMRTDAEDIGAIFQAAMRFVAEHELPPLPHRAFSLAEAADAFRLMAQAQHIGKLVLVPDAVSAATIRVIASTEPRLRRDATYLVVGGTSGFGLSLATWLADRGARHLALISRNGRVSASEQPAIDRLLERGVAIRIMACDVSDAGALADALGVIDTSMPPLAGVFHSAAVYADCVIPNLDAEMFSRPWRPKAIGAWNLHRLTADRTLDYFVMYSSVSGLFGASGQAAYATANAFLEGLAQYRRALGLPGTAVAWGPIGEVGELTRREWLDQFFTDSGIPPLAPADGLRTLGMLLDLDAPPTAVVSMAWDRWARVTTPGPRFSRLVSTDTGVTVDQQPFAVQLAAADPATRIVLLGEAIARAVASVLGTAPEAIDRTTPLTSLGLDSLMAIELSTRLLRQFDVEITSVRLLGGPSVATLVEQFLPPLLAAADSAAPATVVRAAARTAETTVAPGDASADLVPLSYQQIPIWHMVENAPPSSFFNLPAAVRFRGALDVDAFARAIARLVDRHPMLRAEVADIGGEPQQRTTATPFHLVVEPVDADVDREQMAAQRAREFGLTPFIAPADDVFKARLLRFAPDDHLLLLALHHVAGDGASMPILMRDGLMLYAAEAAGGPVPPPPAWSFADFVRWQRKRMATNRRDELVAAWRRLLDGAIPALPLPTDRPRPERSSYRGACVSLEVTAPLAAALGTIARDEQCTTFVTLVTALGLLVHRVTGLDDFCVGTFVANRTRPELRDVVGCFINQVPLRIDLRGAGTVREVVGRVRNMTLVAQAHAELPFALLRQEVTIPMAPTPPLQVVLIFHNELGSMSRYRLSLQDGLSVEFVETENGGAKRDWTFHVYEQADGLSGHLEYDLDLYSAETAERIASGFLEAIEAVAHTPDAALTTLAPEVV